MLLGVPEASKGPPNPALGRAPAQPWRASTLLSRLSRPLGPRRCAGGCSPHAVTLLHIARELDGREGAGGGGGRGGSRSLCCQELLRRPHPSCPVVARASRAPSLRRPPNTSANHHRHDATAR